MVKRAPQTREIDFMAELFRRLKTAYRTADYTPVEEMIHPEAVLTTRQGRRQGTDPLIRHLKAMGSKPFQAQIVAPKGGMVTMLIASVLREGGPARGYEQTYRMQKDRLVELIDYGRTPDMVYRPESQPS